MPKLTDELEERMLAAAKMGKKEPIDAIIAGCIIKPLQEMLVEMALKISAQVGNWDLIQHYLKIPPNNHDTALFYSAKFGHFYNVLRLSQAGANIHLPLINAQTPIVAAALNGHQLIVNYFLALGVQGDQILAITAKRGLLKETADIIERMELVSLDSKDPSDPNQHKLFEKSKRDHATLSKALEQAAVYRHFEVVRVLQKHGAQPISNLTKERLVRGFERPQRLFFAYQPRVKTHAPVKAATSFALQAFRKLVRK